MKLDIQGLSVGLAIGVASCAGAAPTSTPTLTLSPEATPTPPAAAQSTPAPTPALTGAALGELLSAQFGCAVCHSVDGSPMVGPTWKGLYGKVETLTGGATVLVDEAYLRESILDPNAKIVRGFTPDIMPQDFARKLSEEQIQALIEYIKTL